MLRYPELRERAFVVSSFGKTYHCTGWKVGYCIAPPALSAEFRKVHQYNTFCTFAPAQWAFAEMIEQRAGALPASWARSTRPSATASREQLRDDAAEAAAGAGRLLPAGRLFGGQRPATTLAFCRWLTIEKGVAAIPLSPFYESPPPGQRLARLCFAKNEATLDAAIERLRKLVTQGPCNVTAMDDLRVSLVQGDTRWHDPAGNRDYYGHLIAPLHGTTDLVLLPETFTSGFSNEAIGQAETMDGPTVAWMREQAAQARRGDHRQRADPRRRRRATTACCSPRPMARCALTTSATCSATRRNTSATPPAATA